jgi:hypothetical protein
MRHSQRPASRCRRSSIVGDDKGHHTTAIAIAIAIAAAADNDDLTHGDPRPIDDSNSITLIAMPAGTLLARIMGIMMAGPLIIIIPPKVHHRGLPVNGPDTVPTIGS